MIEKPEMKKTITILVADRNRHVRELLKRELAEAGYRILLAKTALEVSDTIYQQNPPDLLILDPDLPDDENIHSLKLLPEKAPSLPIILHMHAADTTIDTSEIKSVGFVEKNGNSIEHVKKIVAEIMQAMEFEKSPPPMYNI